MPRTGSKYRELMTSPFSVIPRDHVGHEQALDVGKVNFRNEVLVNIGQG